MDYLQFEQKVAQIVRAMEFKNIRNFLSAVQADYRYRFLDLLQGGHSFQRALEISRQEQHKIISDSFSEIAD